MPEIHQFAPYSVYVPRKGEVNVWTMIDCNLTQGIIVPLPCPVDRTAISRHAIEAASRPAQQAQHYAALGMRPSP
jgi:hypothetical protein